MRRVRHILALFAGLLVLATPALVAPVAGRAQEPTTTTTTTVPPPTLPHFEQFETEEWHDDWIDWRYADGQNTTI
nr:hypothetical protein [Acidimicrobiia bacterium]